MKKNKKNLFSEIKSFITYLRRNKNSEGKWELFNSLVNENINDICSDFDTRWLVSIADTFVDFGNDVEKRNAMYITLIANFEKLWATRLLMYDIELNKEKVAKLKKNKVVPLWDGMYSFNINRGDLVNNMFARLANLMIETPALNQIYNTILMRLVSEENSTLGNLAQYHKNLLAPPKKRSVFKTIVRKIKSFFNQYRLFLF